MKNIDKRIIEEGFHTEYEVDFVTIQQSDYEYLKEQAERVQELEELVEDYKTVNKELHQRGKKVRKQNKRYREAIEVAIHNMAASDNLGVKFALGILEQALEGEE